MGVMVENPPSAGDGEGGPVEHVDELLEHHVAFDEAVGVLMGLFEADADRASTMLRAKAQQTHVNVLDLTEQILADPASAKTMGADLRRARRSVD
jgi:hypothetical protein